MPEQISVGFVIKWLCTKGTRLLHPRCPIHQCVIITPMTSQPLVNFNQHLEDDPISTVSKEVTERSTNTCAQNKGNGWQRPVVVKVGLCNVGLATLSTSTARRTQQHQRLPLHSSWWGWGPSLSVCSCWRTWVCPALLTGLMEELVHPVLLLPQPWLPES